MPHCTKCGKTPPHPQARFCPSCGSMLGGQTTPDDPWIGRVVADRYRVISSLGEGGMGKVYLAEQQMGTVRRKVAIKALHPELAAEPSIARRFNREAETVIGLGHPNTITFFDFGQTPDGTLYIVMEYIEGESLAHALKAGALTPQRTEHILGQVASSLHEAHEIGIVHRDLKPENIILTQRASQQDFVKVLDFGIAKRTELDADSLRLTRAGVVLGTPPYMSPEQFAGQPLDRRSDIYSLGVMAYEMLTGRLPYKARTPWEWATQHMSAKPAPFETTAEGRMVPESCRRAVLRALAKDPTLRPSTTLELLDELRAELAPPLSGSFDAGALRQPSASLKATRGPTPLPQTQKVDLFPAMKRRHRRWLWILLTVCLGMMALGIAAGAAIYQLGLADRPTWLGGAP